VRLLNCARAPELKSREMCSDSRHPETPPQKRDASTPFFSGLFEVHTW
jgi:hypothetical protein